MLHNLIQSVYNAESNNSTLRLPYVRSFADDSATALYCRNGNDNFLIRCDDVFHVVVIDNTLNPKTNEYDEGSVAVHRIHQTREDAYRDLIAIMMIDDAITE